MKIHYFAIYDKKSGLFGTPVIFNSKAEIMRTLDYMLNINEKRKDDFRYIYAEDYRLVHVFDYDPDTAKVTTDFPDENPIEFALVKKAEVTDEKKAEKNA
jgi:hypothetical protein